MLYLTCSKSRQLLNCFALEWLCLSVLQLSKLSGKQHYDSLLEFKKQMSIMCRVTFMIHENDHRIQLSYYTDIRSK